MINLVRFFVINYDFPTPHPTDFLKILKQTLPKYAEYFNFFIFFNMQIINFKHCVLGVKTVLLDKEACGIKTYIKIVFFQKPIEK